MAVITYAQKRILDYAQRIAYSSVETLMFTFEMAQKYAYSKGCYVECGVAAGAQIIAMAAGAPNTKHIYALDSFEGIPLPSNKDNQMPGIRMLMPDEQAALPDPGKQELVSSGATVVNTTDFWKQGGSRKPLPSSQKPVIGLARRSLSCASTAIYTTRR